MVKTGPLFHKIVKSFYWHIYCGRLSLFRKNPTLTTRRSYRVNNQNIRSLEFKDGVVLQLNDTQYL